MTRMVKAASSTILLEEAQLQFNETLLIFWEQADLVDTLSRNGKPTQTARDVLAAMQQTLDQLRVHIRAITLGDGTPD